MEGVNSHHTYSSLSHLHNSTLSIMYVNARSVFRKLDDLKLVCAIHEPDVICIIRPVGRGVRGGSSEPPLILTSKRFYIATPLNCTFY